MRIIGKRLINKNIERIINLTELREGEEIPVEEEEEEEEVPAKKKKKVNEEEIAMKKALREMVKLPMDSWGLNTAEISTIQELQQFLKYLLENKKTHFTLIEANNSCSARICKSVGVDMVLLPSLTNKGKVVKALLSFI